MTSIIAPTEPMTTINMPICGMIPNSKQKQRRSFQGIIATRKIILGFDVR
jgi:hypothetical protein